MRHLRQVKYFNRDSDARRALLRNLVDALVENERITTTVEKAKELRRHIDRAITMGKKGSLNAQRILLSRYPNKKTVGKLMKDISPRFKARDGGYTRIIKTGRRPGDAAEMAIIEFVDYDFKAAPKKVAEDKKVIKQAIKKVEKKRKRLRKLQSEARKVQRKVKK